MTRHGKSSRTGQSSIKLCTEDTPEEYLQAKLYGARDVEYTVCALVELPYSMSYRYDLRGIVLRNVFRSGGLYSVTGGGTSCGEMLGSMFWFFEYRFTVLPVLLTIPVFLLLGWLIPCMMYDNAAKCSVVEQLRDAQ